MFSTAEKSNTVHVSRQQQTAGTTFFRKAGEDSFFGSSQQSTFFNPVVQAKLSVSSPDDPQEKEADNVADQVMRMSDPVSAPAPAKEDDKLQKKEEPEGEVIQTKADHPTISRIQCKDDESLQTKLFSTVQRSAFGDYESGSDIVCDSGCGGSNINRKATSLYHSDVVQRSGRGPPADSRQFEHSLSSSKGAGSAMPNGTRQFMESRFNADFSGVRIHTGSYAENLSTQIHAQAFTHGNDIYFNSGKYNPHTSGGSTLLAHELTHTIQQGASKSNTSNATNTSVARKPIIQRSYGAPVSQLDNAITKAKSHEGQINAGKEGPDGYRMGWEHLLDIFKTTFGEDKIVSGSGGTSEQGSVAEMDIKKYREAKGNVMVDGDPKRTDPEGLRDAMPSWCGIYVFYALNKSGVPMPKWKLGENMLKREAVRNPGSTPKPGDIAFRNAYSHFALVESVSGGTVRTVNGNTAGEDNMGGQVQTREHPLSNWTAFFNPLATMEGSLGSSEGATPEKPKTLRELRKEVFNVSRKEDGHQEEETGSSDDHDIQTKSEHSSWSVDAGGQLQTGPPSSGYIHNTTIQAKEEGNQEEEDQQQTSQQQEVQRKEFAPPVTQTGEQVQRSVVDDALSYLSTSSVLGCVDITSLSETKACALRKAQEVALHIPGYRALRVVLGGDPITGENIERNGHNFIEAAFDIMPGGRLIHQKLDEQHQLDAAAAWIDEQISRIEGLVDGLFSSFETFWDRLGIDDLTSPMEVLEEGANIVFGFIEDVITFAEEAALELVEMIKEWLLTKIVDFIKENTTAYPLLTVILGKDPITEEEVETNGTNILNALLELGGEEGRKQRDQMQETGTFEKIVGYIDEGISIFSTTYDDLLQAFKNIWDIVSIESLMDPRGTFTEIYNQFAGPVGTVLDFVIRVAAEILKLIKEVLMQRLSAWAKEQRGYELVTVIIEKDPFTEEVVPRSAENLIKGFMSLMEGGREQYNQLKESGAIDRTVAKINAAVDRLNMTPGAIIQLFIDLWNSFSLDDLMNPPAAFRRIFATFGEPIGRLVNFVIEIVKIVVEAILIVMNFPFDLINNIIAKAMQAFQLIKRDPVGFLKNLLRAIKQGFIQFFDNILQHLLSGLVGWLTSELRDAGVPAFTDTSLRGIISWVLEVLGISMEKIWEKLAAHPRIGPEKVARIRSMINTLEGIWTFIKDVQERGMAAIWDKIQEQLSNLWDTIINAVKNWIMEQIITQMVTKLLSMLDPTGIMAVINSAIALYKAIQSFMKYLREMLEVVNSFVEGVVDIANGNVATAANYLERTLARAMPIVIGFLANQVGLSGIGRRVGELIGRAREMVDEALTWLVNKAVDTGMNLLDRAMAMGRSAVSAVLNWAAGLLGLQQPFTTQDGASHRIYFVQQGETVKLMLNPSPVGEYVQKMNEINAPSSVMVTIPAAISVPLQRNGSVVSTVVVPAGSVSMADLKGHAIQVGQHIDGLIRSNMRTRTETDADGGRTQDQTPDFSASLVGLSSITNHILSAESSGPMPVTPVPAYGGLSNGFATSMDVKPLTKLGVPGTGVSITNPAYEDLLLRRQTPGGRSYYIAGHLLNNNVHGSGSTWQNLTPIAQATNQRHEQTVESKVKEAVDKDLILHYTVNVEYGIPANAGLIGQITANANFRDISILNEKYKILQAESKLPTKLSCSLKQVQADGTDLPTSDPKYDAEYNFTGREVDNTANVAQDSLDSYYLGSATAVTYKTLTVLMTEAGVALASNAGLTYDAFYNNPANKVSIDNLAHADQETLRNVFRKKEMINGERNRISALASLVTWTQFNGGREAYTGPLLTPLEKMELYQRFYDKMVQFKVFLINGVTDYVNTRLVAEVPWDDFRNTQQLRARSHQDPAGAERIILSQSEVDTFRTTVFNPKIAQIRAAAAAAAAAPAASDSS